MDQSSEFLFPRVIGVWLLSILFALFLIELGCATGLIPLAVLDETAHGTAGWWRRPFWLHGAASLLLLAAIWRFSTLLLRSVRPSVGGGRRPFAGSAKGSRILWMCFGLFAVFSFIEQLGETRRVVSNMTDFGTFYDAAVAMLAGREPYEATRGAYFYPPTFAFYFRSMVWLPKAGASLLWFTVKLSLAVWSLVAVDALLEGKRFSGARRVWFLAGLVFVAARFLAMDLKFGNTNILILWLVILALALDFKGRAVPAGCALAAAISIKIIPIVFVAYFLVRGRVRVVAWTFLWLIAMNLLPFAFAPRLLAEAWRSYFAVGMAGKLAGSIAQPDNQSLWGFLNRSLPAPLSLQRFLWIGCSLALAGVAAWSALRARRGGSARQAGAASLFFLLGLLASPGSWVVHYSAVLLPMAYLLREAMTARPWSLFLWVVFAAANLVFAGSGLTRLGVRLSIEHSLFVAAACLVFFAIAWRVARGDEAR